jgi:hypothetical protein
MVCDLKRSDQISFRAPEDARDDSWIRLDADESGVTFDRGGLLHLDASDCLQLAAWLTNAAAEIPPPRDDAKGRGRPTRARRPRRAARPAGEVFEEAEAC